MINGKGLGIKISPTKDLKSSVVGRLMVSPQFLKPVAMAAYTAEGTLRM